MKYLGHIVSARGIQPDPVKAVKNFPRPTEVKELKGFIGLAGYYRRFVPGFSQIATLLFQLQEKGTDFVWTEASERAFTVLKERLTEPPVLAFPQFDKPFHLATDASETGLGAVLSQVIEGKERVVFYASRALRKAEHNYSTVEKEALAIVWAVTAFRPYLYVNTKAIAYIMAR